MFPNGNFVDHIRPAIALAPAADRLNTDPETDFIQLKDYRKVVFLVFVAGGTTGKGTITVQQADNAAGDNPVAMAFKYSRLNGATLGALTAVAATGVQTTAGETSIYVVEVDASELTDGKAFINAVLTEDVDDPVNGAVIALSMGGRQGTTPSAVA